MKIKLVIIDTYENTEKPNTKDYCFIDTERVKHIDRWEYSPKSSQRLIETVFE